MTNAALMRLLAISYRTNSPAIASLNEYLKLFAEPFNNSLAGFHYLLLKLCCISKSVPQAFSEPQIHLDVVMLKAGQPTYGKVLCHVIADIATASLQKTEFLFQAQ